LAFRTFVNGIEALWLIWVIVDWFHDYDCSENKESTLFAAHTILMGVGFVKNLRIIIGMFVTVDLLVRLNKT